MRILVCIKQVPDTAEIKTDPERGTLIREGVKSIMNPYDGYALEAAARIKDSDPDTEITALSMGPASAEAVLREALSVAADRAVLLTDAAFAGSDTLATGYILSKAVKKLEEENGPFDLVFCGRQAVDGDTAQVGPQLAVRLGVPYITCALTAGTADGTLVVKKQTEDGTELLEADLPALVTFTKPAWEMRHPSLKRKLAAKKAEITVLKAEDLPGFDGSKAGLGGSPTRVRRTYVPLREKGGIIIKKDSAKEAAEELFRMMKDRGIIGIKERADGI